MMEEKIISFGKGIHRGPSLSADSGELSECVNLIPVGGELKNIKSPVGVPTGMEGDDDPLAIPASATLLAIHHVEDGDHYVYVEPALKGGEVLNYMYFKDGYWEEYTELLSSDTSLGIKSVAITGNIITVVKEDGITYLVWKPKEGLYSVLTDMPTATMDFRLDSEVVATSYGTPIIVGKGTGTNDDGGSIYTTSLAQYDVDKAKTIEKKDFPEGMTVGKYYAVVNTGTGRLGVAKVYGNEGKSSRRIDPGRAYVFLYDSGLDGLWVDKMFQSENHGSCSINKPDTEVQNEGYIVKNTNDNFNAMMSFANRYIDEYYYNLHRFIFPFYVRYGLTMYDGTVVNLSEPILMVPNSSTCPILHIVNDLDNRDGEVNAGVSAVAFCCNLQAKVEMSNVDNWKDLITGITIGISAPIYKYNAGEVYNASLVRGAIKKYDPDNLEDFYCVAKASDDGGFMDLFTYNDKSSGPYFIIPPSFSDKAFEANHLSKGNFYKIKEYKWSELTTRGEDYFDIDLQDVPLKDLETLPVLEDNYRTISKLYPEGAFAYNSRLNIFNVRESLGSPQWPISPYFEGNGNTKYKIVFFVEGHTLVSEWYDINSPCKWIYCSYGNASKAVLFRSYTYKIKDSDPTTIYQKATIELSAHNLLSGSYALLPNGPSFESCQLNDTNQYTNDPLNAEPSKNMIFASKVNNPFYFPAEGRSQVGQGEILAVNTSAKALSSGTEHGKYPLYCFCSDGVWPLSIEDDGKFGAPDAAVRDVVENIKSICQIDGGLVYATQAGLRLLSGENVVTLSDMMRGRNADENTFMESLTGDHAKLVIRDTNSIVDMLSTSTVLRDFANNMLHIYPADPGANATGDKWKHYVLNLDTSEWSTVVDTDSKIKSVIPGWPYYTLQNSKGELKQFRPTDDQETFKDGVLLTRPIAFDDPMAMKIIGDLRMMYSKTVTEDDKSQCRLQIYASNDRATWYAVNSLRAKSWKWYRFRIRTHLTDLDALSGLACMTENRRTNKLR